MKRVFSTAISSVIFLIAATGLHAKEHEIKYIQYQICNYSKNTQQYCSDEDEPVYKGGSAKLNISDDSLVTFTFNKDKSYQFRYNRMREDVNSSGEKVIVTTGQSRKGENFMMVNGPGYLNLIKTKQWAMYFTQGKNDKSKKEALKTFDFGKAEYTVASISSCEFNEKTEDYDKNCSFKNAKEKYKFVIASKMRGENLYLDMSNISQISVIDAKSSKNDDNEPIVTYYGVDDEGEDVYVTLAPSYFNIAVGGEVGTFSERLLPEDMVTHNIVTGSGVAVTNDVIVTNAHVTENMETVKIYLDGKEVKTDSINFIGEMPKEVLDFAVIKVFGAKLSACPIATKEPGLGDEVLVYGYPKIGIQGNDLKVTKGIVSGKNGIMGNKKMFQIDAAVQPGNSGGPIVSKGKVIGLATLQMSNLQNVNVGIKSSKMIHLLRFFDVEPKSSTSDFSKCTYLLVGED